jgi:hypothetical protein
VRAERRDILNGRKSEGWGYGLELIWEGSGGADVGKKGFGKRRKWRKVK